jgi:hypothetical protein
MSTVEPTAAGIVPGTVAFLEAVRRVVRGTDASVRPASAPHRRSSQADLLRLRIGDTPVVVKDYAGKPWLYRRLGRIQIARECAAYERLAGVAGVPRYYGRIDAYAFAMEDVGGVRLSRWPVRADHPRLLAQLADAVERIHAAGVVHFDLRCAGNVVVRPGGEVCILDFASAIWMRPNSLERTLLLPLLQLIDRSAVVKVKWRLGLPLTPAEEGSLNGFRAVSRLWRSTVRPWKRRSPPLAGVRPLPQRPGPGGG